MASPLTVTHISCELIIIEFIGELRSAAFDGTKSVIIFNIYRSTARKLDVKSFYVSKRVEMRIYLRN